MRLTAINCRCYAIFLWFDFAVFVWLWGFFYFALAWVYVQIILSFYFFVFSLRTWLSCCLWKLVGWNISVLLIFRVLCLLICYWTADLFCYRFCGDFPFAPPTEKIAKLLIELFSMHTFHASWTAASFSSLGLLHK